MTNPDLTLLVGIIDRSGSMSSIAHDMQGGWNELVRKQAAEIGRCEVLLADFDTEHREVYHAWDAMSAPTYQLIPRGGTALLDAVGRTVTRVGEMLADRPEDQRPSKVIVAIITDGEENSSQEWTLDEVNALVERQQKQWHWHFTYLGANQDAIKVAQGLGIARGQAMTYTADHVGTVAVASALGNFVTTTRTSGLSYSYTDIERTEAQS